MRIIQYVGECANLIKLNYFRDSNMDILGYEQIKSSVVINSLTTSEAALALPRPVGELMRLIANQLISECEGDRLISPAYFGDIAYRTWNRIRSGAISSSFISGPNPLNHEARREARLGFDQGLEKIFGTKFANQVLDQLTEIDVALESL
jgi:hypothetical protein